MKEEAEVASHEYSVRLIENMKDADPCADITVLMVRGWVADRIVSLERVYPGNRDWCRDLEREGERRLHEDRYDSANSEMTRRYHSRE